MKKVSRLVIMLSLFVSVSVFGQSKNTIALFNLTPISIDTIGLDGDLLFGLRSELGLSPSLSVIPRRQMEEDLYRIGGAQVEDTKTVIKYGREIGADYVFTGTIGEDGGRIVGEFKLVDTVRGVDVAIWKEYFADSSRLSSYSSRVSTRIRETIHTISEQKIDHDLQDSTDPILEIHARMSGNAVSVTWQPEPSLDVFFYNVYRAKGKDDSFEFLTSVQETQYVDNDLPSNDHYFYRVGLALNSGEELESTQLVSVAVSNVVASELVSPPIIIGQTQWLNGIEFDFTPSITHKQAVEGYRVYQKQTETKWKEIGFVKNTEQLEYRFSYFNKLIPNTNYAFAVTSITNAGLESKLSTVVNISTQPQITLTPDQATYLRRVKLIWDKTPEGAKGANLYRRKDETEEWRKVTTFDDLANNSIVDQENLDDGQRNQYSVSFFDDKTESALSGFVTAYTKAPLAPPDNFLIRSGVKSNYLEWQSVDDTDVKGYVIYRHEGELKSPEDGVKLAFVSSDTDHFVDGVGEYPSLKDGQKYHYTLATINRFDGQGPVGSPVSATTKPRPSRVKNVSALANSDTISVKWESAPEKDIRAYHVYRRWNDEDWVRISSVPQSDNSYIDADLKPYAKTFFKIVSEDSDGLESDESLIVETLSPATLSLSVTKDDLLREIHLEWKGANNIEGYRVYRRLESSSEWTLIDEIRRSSTTKYVDEDIRSLRDGLTYLYQITAYDEYIETEPSNSVRAKTKSLPAPPSLFTAISNEVKQVTLNWQSSHDQDVGGYKVYLITTDGQQLLKTINSRTVNSYVDTWRGLSKLKDGTSYTYAISAFNTLKSEGLISAEVSAITKPVPEKVAGLLAYEEEAQITITWNANTESDIDYYEVYRGTSCTSARRISKVDASFVNYIDDGVSPGRSYCYKVRAVNDDGLDGEFSDTQQLTTSEETREEAL